MTLDVCAYRPEDLLQRNVKPIGNVALPIGSCFRCISLCILWIKLVRPIAIRSSGPLGSDQ